MSWEFIPFILIAGIVVWLVIKQMKKDGDIDENGDLNI